MGDPREQANVFRANVTLLAGSICTGRNLLQVDEHTMNAPRAIREGVVFVRLHSEPASKESPCLR